jgi:putative acetyltransferase
MLGGTVVHIRHVHPDDAEAVRSVHQAAFGRPEEAALVTALQRGGAARDRLCFVAQRGGAVVGHVMCSTGDIGGRPAVGLGPLGVLPAQQRGGAGSALMHAVIGAAEATGEPLVALLGDPAYYRRFGFVTATTLGVQPPVAAWGAHFQIRALSAFDASWHGTFRYAAPFDDV